MRRAILTIKISILGIIFDFKIIYTYCQIQTKSYESVLINSAIFYIQTLS